MSVTITGIVKYARHMKGDNNGVPYSFFSFVVLDPEEGVRWPLQVQEDHKDFTELVAHEQDMVDRWVEVGVRSFSAGYRNDKKTSQKVPQARFYAKSVQVLASAPGR